MHFKKTTLFFCLSLICTLTSYGQSENYYRLSESTTGPEVIVDGQKSACGTSDPSPEIDDYIRNVVMQQEVPASRMMTTDCVPMKVHIVRQDDGSGGVSLEDISQGIANLNNVFQANGVEFFVCGAIDYINDSDFYDFDGQAPDNDTEAGFVATHGEASDAVNVWFMNSLITSSGFNAAGYAYFPFNSAQSNRIFMINSATDGPVNGTFVHELGHYFSLYHTHQATEFGTGTEGNTGANAAERVARTGPDANCGDNGDLLCDTQADPRYDSSNFDFGSCSIPTDETDGTGAVYTPDIDNIMSYYPDACGGNFTAQQSTRMTQGYMTRLTHTAYNYSCSGDAVNAPTGLTATQNGSAVDLTWTDNAANEFGYIIERSETSATDGFKALVEAGVGPDVTAYSDNTAASSTTYWYRVRPVNAACTSYSNVATVSLGLVYCTPGHQSNSCTVSGIGVGIDDFTLSQGGSNLINNASNGCNGPLSDYSSSFSANLTAGDTYTITLGLLSSGGSFFPALAEVWIDLNQNGDYTDAGENVGSIPTGGSTLSGTITIPAAVLNGTTKLRVRAAYEPNGPVSSPCDYRSFSEAEDYEVIISGGTLLPVELLSFTGKATEKGSLLQWETEQEVNSAYFAIERSRDGSNFEAIGEIESAGESSDLLTYNFLDEEPLSGENYYRLRAVDRDGSFSFSEIITVLYRGNGSVAVIPNPVRANTFAVNYKTDIEGEVNLQVVDGTGRVVATQSFYAEEGEGQQQLSIDNLPTGIYFLRFNQESNLQTVRFVKL